MFVQPVAQVDVDVGSSASASSVVGLVAGAVKNLVIDMAVVLQVITHSTNYCYVLYFCHQR